MEVPVDRFPVSPPPRLVSDIMGRTVCQDEETLLEDLCILFEDGEVAGAPILNHDGHVVGVVARIDVPEELEPRRLLQARDVMEPVEQHVRKSWPVEWAAQVIDSSPLSDAFPVFDDESEDVVGVISRESLYPPPMNIPRTGPYDGWDP
ncbi:MAG: CBS domain-containing protein [Deltaproteobacteria bacterium]|nr:CBS domain-containing protein [Deltaproteobacteria bacterium]